MIRYAIALAPLVFAACATPSSAQNYPARSILMTSQSVLGEEIVYPTDGRAIVSAIIVTLAPGEQTAVHTHGAPFFAYILEGEITVDYGERGKRTYRTGEALMEAMSVAHAGLNTGDAPVRLLAVSMSSEGASSVLLRR